MLGKKFLTSLYLEVYYDRLPHVNAIRRDILQIL